MTTVHPLLREMASMVDTDNEQLVNDYLVSRNSATWSAQCGQCLGAVTVQHIFSDGEWGPHARTLLPDTCPRKPSSEDAPFLFFEDITLPPSSRQQGSDAVE